MNDKYAFLEPIQVGSKTFKNRIIYPAQGKHLATKDGFVTDEYIEYFRSIARGGVAAAVTGIQVIDPEWHYISDRQTWICDDKYIPGLKKLCDAVHAEDCLMFFQPWHSGQAGQPTGLDGFEPITLNDFSIDEIHEIQDKWFEAARRAKKAGADGIEFHNAHTYLPGQFLSPEWNHRHDEYGIDTIENATRFAREIIERISEELCDESFILILKINGDDYLENGGGVHIERCIEACKIFEKAGVKLITVNGGGAISRVECMSDNGCQPEGWKVHLAESVKKAVHVPVAASGSLRHPDYVSKIIEAGRCDLAAIGRGIFAERDWVKKCMEGREEELRYCISCMYCFTTAPDGVAGCSVNPFAKRETEKPKLVKDGDGRQVVVVGGGPSGLEAAVTLAERNFDVTLIDEKTEIGGMVTYAMMPPDKYKLGWMLEYYQKQIDRLHIKLELGVKANKAYIDEKKPYAVVVATGSREFIPSIRASEILSVREAFEMAKSGRNMTGDTIILGAGLTGIELGHLIQSSGGTVHILELMPKPSNMNMEMKLALKAAIKDGVDIRYEQKVVSVTPGSVTAVDMLSGDVYTQKTGRIIRSMGIRSEDTLYEELHSSDASYKVYAVGDCERTGKISTAVQSGADTAFALK